MSTKSVLSVIFAASLIFTASCAGGKSSDNNETTTSPETTTGSSEVSETEVPPPDIEAVDCGGRDYVILNRQHGEYSYPFAEILSEEENGDTMNDAVWERNLYIEEKYNLNLVSYEVPTGDQLSTAKQTILSGDSTYDLIMTMISDGFSLAMEGCLTDISSLPHIDLKNPWWVDSMISDTSIGSKNYIICGDINVSVLNAVGATFFNKNLAEELGIGDLYQIVRDYEWTLDKMTELARLASYDVNGNAEVDSGDRFGLDCSTFAWQPLFYGTGSSMITKDENDIPHLSWDTEHNLTALGKIVSLLNERATTICVNHYSEFSSDLGGATFNLFSNGQALFFSEVMYGAMQLRDMQDDFGILPLPKYDDSQDSYYSYVHTNNSSTSCVPITNSDLDLAGRLLEDMAYKSYTTVRPAFYDVALKVKYSRDDESAEMLDIIYDNINIDLTLVMNRSGLTIDNTLRSAMQSGATDLVSLIAGQKSACEAIIDRNAETILNLEK